MHGQLGDIFCNLDISLGGFRYRSKRILELKKMAEALTSEVQTHTTVFLLEDNPLSFALQFLSLLDHQCVPVCLQSGITELQRQEYKLKFPHLHWIENGVLTEAKLQQASEFPGHYGVLTNKAITAPDICYFDVKAQMAHAKDHSDFLRMDSSMRIIQTLPLYHSFTVLSYLFTSIQLHCALDLNLSFLGLGSLARLELMRGVIHFSPDQVHMIGKEKGLTISGMEIVNVLGDSIAMNEMAFLKQRFEEARFYTSYESEGLIFYREQTL